MRPRAVGSVVGVLLGVGALAAPALGGTRRVEVEATVEYRLEGEAWAVPEGDYRARGVYVGAYTRKVLGIPIISDSATTDRAGRVRLSVKVRNGRQITLRVVTRGPAARTVPGGIRAVFGDPYRADARLPRDDSRRDSVRRTVRFGGRMNEALMVQDVGHRTLELGRDAFRGVRSSWNDVTYVYPGKLKLSDDPRAYTPTAGRVVLYESDRSRRPETIMHETGHTFWYQARGRVEYYAPFTHSLKRLTGSRTLALSEGFADYFAVFAGDHWARAQGRPEAADQAYGRSGCGEVHRLYDRAPGTWQRWGDQAELNVLCALWDLTDREEDDRGVVAGLRDRANGGDLPAGKAAARAILQGIRATRGERRIDLRTLWSRELRAVWGARGAEALTLNGVEVR